MNLEVPYRSRNKVVGFNALLDTGAMINVISCDALKELELQGEKLREINTAKKTTLKMYDRSCSKTLGAIRMPIQWGNEARELEFQVVDKDVETILSAKTCLDMKLITTVDDVQHVNLIRINSSSRISNLREKYEDIFTGLGKLPQPVEIYIKPHAIPVQQPVTASKKTVRL